MALPDVSGGQEKPRETLYPSDEAPRTCRWWKVWKENATDENVEWEMLKIDVKDMDKENRNQLQARLTQEKQFRGDKPLENEI